MNRAANMIFGIVIAVTVGVIALPPLIIAWLHDGGTTKSSTPTRAEFCSVLTRINGSQLIDQVRAGQIGRQLMHFIVDRWASVALTAIARDMATVRDGVEAQPTHPSRSTVAAGARVDAFARQTCGQGLRRRGV